MSALTIDLVSDIACPWCAIGYGRLQKALAQLDDIDVSLTWRAFELQPDPDVTPEPITPALARKYNVDEAQIEQSQKQMMDIAAGLGINFEKMEQRYTCNTFDGHRLVKWATRFDKQTPMKLALFDAYFGKGLSVDNHEVLLDAAEQAGLDRTLAAELLLSDEYSEQVRQEEQQYPGLLILLFFLTYLFTILI